VATGVSKAGYREILGVAEGAKEDAESWLNFFRHMKSRGLKDVRLIVSDKCLGVVEAAAICFPDARWQRCIVHFYRNIFSSVPRAKMREVANMLKAIHAQEDRPSAEAKAQQVVSKLREMRLADAAECLQHGITETLAYLAFPPEHWVRIRTTNALERIMREIRRRTRVVGNFPDGKSALMLVAARLRYVLGTVWGSRLYLNMEFLKDIEIMTNKNIA
jgi:transposase-like protein